MGNATYYFASNKNEEELSNIVSDPLFNKIVDYLSNRKGQEVILRQIKTDILTNDNLELYLDKLIKYDLLERKNRRYSLTFPVYSNEKSLPTPDSITHLLKEIVQIGSTVTNHYVFGEWLWSLLFKEEQDNYFFGVKNSIESFPIFSRREVGNDSLRFVSVYPNGTIPLDLANYFDFLSKRQELPEQFETLQKIIGDVDIHYFIPQIQKIIRSVRRNRSREGKTTIFQEALLVTGDLKKNEDHSLILAVPILEDVPSNQIQLTLDEIKAELIPMWEMIHDKNQRIFFKHQLYSILFDYCLPEEDHLSYFKS